MTTSRYVLRIETMSGGHWQFSLIADNGRIVLSAADHEACMSDERLELLALVRGLESLDQPAQVTLVTDSRYVRHGLSFGLAEWRENDYCWERFGELVPVKNVDLWQRVDRALQFHRVDCRTWRFDTAHATADRSQARRKSADMRRSPSWRQRAARAAAAFQGRIKRDVAPAGA